MAYQNVKVKARQAITQSSQTKKLGTVSEVPMGDWNAETTYKKLNLVRYNGATYIAKRDNQSIEPTITSSWQEFWQVVVYDGSAVIPTGTYPEMTVGKATNDGEGNNIAEQFTSIDSKIPSSASENNQLADKDFVTAAVNNLSAFYITYTKGSATEMGQAFPTQASLLNATTFYSGAQVRIPTQNDYAIVLQDENYGEKTTRYSYQGGTYPNGAWAFQYMIAGQDNNILIINFSVADWLGTSAPYYIEFAANEYNIINSNIICVPQIKTDTLIEQVNTSITIDNNTHNIKIYSNKKVDGKLLICGNAVQDLEIVQTTGQSKTAIMSQKAVSDAIQQSKKIFFDLLYPVNSRYIQFYGCKEPAELFGGDWEIDSDYAGKTIVGSGTTINGISYVFGATGGEETHTLTVDELSIHNHNPLHFIGGSYNNYKFGLHGGSTVSGVLKVSDTISTDNNWGSAETLSDTNSGGNQPHNNMPPFKVVNIWIRKTLGE